MKKKSKDRLKYTGAGAAVVGGSLASTKYGKKKIGSSRLVRKLALRSAKKGGLSRVSGFSSKLGKALKYGGPTLATGGSAYLGYRLGKHIKNKYKRKK